MQTSADSTAAQKRYTLEDVEQSLTLPKTWWAYAAILPFAKRLSLWIANHTRLTPNHITLISFASIIVATLFFIQGGWIFLIFGALFYELNYMFDCVDGTIAKLKNKGSIEGSFLDFFFDQWRNFAATFGLSYGYYLRHDDFSILLIAMLYIFLEELYLLRDAKIDHFLRKSNMIFLSIPSPLLFRFGPFKNLMAWMSRSKLYCWPTIIEVDALVFFAAPLLNIVKEGMIAGVCLFLLMFFYKSVKFFVFARRSRGMIGRLLSPEVRSIALFGSGAVAKRFHEWAEENNIAKKIIHAADNNSKKWGEESFVPVIINPEDLHKREADIIIIASQHGYYDIAFQLAEMNFRPRRDFIAMACR